MIKPRQPTDKPLVSVTSRTLHSMHEHGRKTREEKDKKCVCHSEKKVAHESREKR